MPIPPSIIPSVLLRPPFSRCRKVNPASNIILDSDQIVNLKDGVEGEKPAPVGADTAGTAFPPLGLLNGNPPRTASSTLPWGRSCASARPVPANPTIPAATNIETAHSNLV